MTLKKMRAEDTQEVRAQPTVGETQPTPLLKHGERLTREEFERRYEAMPEIKKAELIEGVVYMPASPVRTDIHGEPHARVMTWLGVYWAATPGTQLSDNATVELGADSEPQPDALLRIEESRGGKSFLNDKGYIEGAPELIVEVAGTSVDYDLNDKLKVYRRVGVGEYVVWRTQDKQIDWFRLVEGEYVPLTPDAEGVIQSQVFPGLRLAVAPLLEGDLATVLSEVQKGIATAEHAAFVERCRATRCAEELRCSAT